MNRKNIGILIFLISVSVLGSLYLLTHFFTTMPEPNRQTTSTTEQAPNLSVSTVVSGLDHPWDIDFLPDETLLFTERFGAISQIVDGKKVIIASLTDVDARGEGGLMGLAVDPDYKQNKKIYTCYNSVRGDIRVVSWMFDGDKLSNEKNVVTGITSAVSGRHSGCQVAFGPDGNLWIGTGDAADETQPQDKTKLGGKILRVTREGKPAEGNPSGPDRRVFSFGHRNTQALAFYPESQEGSYGISIEHGSYRDDEANELKVGNFGWAPGSGYDESVPMTDTAKFPDAITSVWSSGSTTIAPSGAAFLEGENWKALDGWLAVSVLKDQKLLLLNMSDGKVVDARNLFEGEHGRLRATTLGPDGALYVSTDDGTNDSLLRIAPSDD